MNTLFNRKLQFYYRIHIFNYFNASCLDKPFINSPTLINDSYLPQDLIKNTYFNLKDIQLFIACMSSKSLYNLFYKALIEIFAQEVNLQLDGRRLRVLANFFTIAEINYIKNNKHTRTVNSKNIINLDNDIKLIIFNLQIAYFLNSSLAIQNRLKLRFDFAKTKVDLLDFFKSLDLHIIVNKVFNESFSQNVKVIKNMNGEIT